MLVCLLHRYSYFVSLEIVVGYRKLGRFQGTYKLFHNILRLFDVLRNFAFTTSETMRDYYLHAWYFELPHELPNDLTLRILGKE